MAGRNTGDFACRDAHIHRLADAVGRIDDVPAFQEQVNTTVVSRLLFAIQTPCDEKVAIWVR